MDRLAISGPSYVANASKTWLATKEEYLADSTSFFADTDVNVTSEGRTYFGVAIGS